MRPLKSVFPYLYSVGWAIHPLLFLTAQNIHQVHLEEIFWPVLCFAGVAIVLGGTLQIKLKNSHKSSFLNFLLWGMIFTYGPFSSLLQPLSIPSRVIFFGWILAFGTGILWVLRSHRSFQSITPFLTVMVFSLCVISVGEITLYQIKHRWRSSTQRDSQEPLSDLKVENTTPPPDIYYIILDRYAGWQTLRDVYQFNNLPFLMQLQKRGFYIATQARANYLKTAHSLASSLNLTYLNSLNKQELEGSDWTPIYEMIQRPKVWDFLKTQGYQYIHLGSWWGPTQKNPNASLNINRASLSELLTVLYQNTLIAALAKEFPWLSSSWMFMDVRREHYERILYQFEMLPKIVSQPSPKFVFAHFIVPHVPYVFDAEGNYVTREETLYKTKQENYCQQLQFVNKKILEVIDRILADSSRPPVILLQADEGPLPDRYESNESQFNWKQATEQELKEKFEILSAYYCPKVDTSVLYPEITPVNSFRLIFNLYFGTQLKRLPDECFAFDDERHLYHFFPVTEKVR
ncbi:MAG: sulfatase-like hydrolase/transferase [Planctomycetota bacterium]